MKYQSILVTQRGGPETLQIVESDLRPLKASEARLRVLAAAVSLPDVEVLRPLALPAQPTPCSKVAR